MVAVRRSRLAAISSFSCGSMIGILPALRASTSDLVDVEADHAEAAAGEHRGERRAELAEADDVDAGESLAEVIFIPVLRAGTDTVAGRREAIRALRRTAAGAKTRRKSEGT